MKHKISKKNLKAAKLLVERYRTIDREEIEKEFSKSRNVMTKDLLSNLTGFGDMATCILCLSIEPNIATYYPDCKKCIHMLTDVKLMFGNTPCLNHETYKAIEKVRTKKGLLKAYRNRADYIESLINKYEAGDVQSNNQ